MVNVVHVIGAVNFLKNLFFLFLLPWFHENTTKMDLSMKIYVQHLFKVVLQNTENNIKGKLNEKKTLISSE